MLAFSNSIKQNSHVLLAISIGQEHQTGAGFAAMVDLLITNPSVRTVTLLKADSLQRHRLQAASQATGQQIEEESLTAAIQASQEWEKANAEALQKLASHKGKVEIKTWEDYRSLDSFADKHLQIEDFYTANSSFRHQVDSIVDNFCKKIQKDLKTKYNHKLTVELMRRYVKEECAVLILMSEDPAQYEYEVYRGQRNRAMSMALREFGQPGRLKSVPLLDKSAPPSPHLPQQSEFPRKTSSAGSSTSSTSSIEESIPENLEEISKLLKGIRTQLTSIQLLLAQANEGSLAVEICNMFIELVKFEKRLVQEMATREQEESRIVPKSSSPQGNKNELDSPKSRSPSPPS